MDSQFSKGILLELITRNNETVQGRFHSQSKDKSKVTLYNVKELPDGEIIEGLTHYYVKDIESIAPVTKRANGEAVPVSVEETLKFPEDEKKQLELLALKYIFVNQVDSKFYKAIEDLKEFSYVAVGTDFAKTGRKCKLPLLTISTPHQIYIFDIQVMEYHVFNSGLRQLLEDDYPKKITHDCRRLSDCLQHNHAVRLNSVFDTQVCDAIIHKHRYGRLPTSIRSLQKCLTEYLGIPSDYLNETTIDMADWSNRPLSVAVKESTARNILYLHKLSVVMNEAMLQPLKSGTQVYLDILRQCDDFKAFHLTSQEDKQLPKEFHDTLEFI